MKRGAAAAQALALITRQRDILREWAGALDATIADYHDPDLSATDVVERHEARLDSLMALIPEVLGDENTIVTRRPPGGGRVS